MATVFHVTVTDEFWVFATTVAIHLAPFNHRHAVPQATSKHPTSKKRHLAAAAALVVEAK